jgi:methionyl-tRNA formyltransferase
LCCVNRDLESSYGLNLLLPQLAQYVTRVVYSERVGRTPGTSEAHLQPLRAVEQVFPNDVLFPMLDRMTGQTERWRTFSELALYCQGVVPQHLDLNSDAGRDFLTTFAPDLIVSMRYGTILRAGAIAVPRLGVINLHSGILPQYRGILSTLYAVAAGESEVGCTLHWIVDAGIDSGPIIAVARRPVEAGRSLLWHILSLYPLGIPLIVETVRRLTNGEDVPRATQEPGEGAYHSVPGPGDVAALEARGVPLVDTSDLHDILRMYAPLA